MTGIGPRTARTCVFAALALMPSDWASADPAAAWRVDNVPATGAVVMLAPDRDPPSVEEAVRMSSMERALRGVSAVIAKDKMQSLRGCAPAPAAGGVVESSCSERWRIHLQGAKGGMAALSVLESRGSALFARRRALNDEPGTWLRFERTRFMKLLDDAGGARYRGSFDAEADSTRDIRPVVPTKLDAPYVAGDLTMDRETMDERIFFRATQFPGTTRTLGQDAMWCRVPKRYSPRAPAGVIVWINADPSGSIPEVLAQALDEFDLIGVGADNSGNDRPLPDRVQLALDALATTRERFNVDDRRVYVSGISGGGRVASMLAIAMPSVFRGAVPIVGLNSHERVEVITRGRGTQVQASFAKPKPPHWTGAHGARIAPITGGQDFNQPEIHARAPGIEKLGFEVRIFEKESMSHQLPSPDLLREAIAWVDEPARSSRAQLVERSEAAWTALSELQNADASFSAEQRSLLVDIMRRFPWTPAAWRAYERLARAGGGAPTKAPRTTP